MASTFERMKKKTVDFVDGLISAEQGELDLLGRRYRLVVLCLKLVWFIFMTACFAALILHSKLIVIDFAEENTVTDIILETVDVSKLVTTQCVKIDETFGLNGLYESSPFMSSDEVPDTYFYNYLAHLSESFHYFLERPNLWFNTMNFWMLLQDYDWKQAVRITETEMFVTESPAIENMDEFHLSPASGGELLDGMKELRARSKLEHYLTPISNLTNIQLVRQKDSWFVCFDVQGVDVKMHLHGAVEKNERARLVSISSYLTPISELSVAENPLWYTYRFEEIEMSSILKVDSLKYSTVIGSQIHLKLYDRYKKRNGACIDAPANYKIPIGRGNDFCRSACFTKEIEKRFKCSYLDKPAVFFEDYQTFDETCNSFKILRNITLEMAALDIWDEIETLYGQSTSLPFLILNKYPLLGELQVKCAQVCEEISFCQQWDFNYNDRLISLSMSNLKSSECEENGMEHEHGHETENAIVNVFEKFYVVNSLSPSGDCWAAGNVKMRYGLYPLATDRFHKRCINWKFSGFPTVGDHSYCSNPGGDDGPWCFTSYNNHDHFTWDYCLNSTCDGRLLTNEIEGSSKVNLEWLCIESNDKFMDNVCFNTTLPICLSKNYVGQRKQLMDGVECLSDCRGNGYTIPSCEFKPPYNQMPCFYDCSVAETPVYVEQNYGSQWICWNSMAITETKYVFHGKNTSRFNIPCENWSEHLNVHHFSDLGDEGINHSSCAAPYKDNAPWCFVMGSDSRLTWQYCYEYFCDFRLQNIFEPVIETEDMRMNTTVYCMSQNKFGDCWRSTDPRCRGHAYFGNKMTTRTGDVCSAKKQGGLCIGDDLGPSCYVEHEGNLLKEYCFRMCSDDDPYIALQDNGYYCYYTDYKPNLNKVLNATRNGEPCLNWVSVFDLHYFDTDSDNHCLNPDGDVASWCFFNDINGSVSWDYCVNSTCFNVDLGSTPTTIKLNQSGYCEKDVNNRTCWDVDDDRCVPNSGYYNGTSRSTAILCDSDDNNMCGFRGMSVPSCLVDGVMVACYSPCRDGCIWQTRPNNNSCWDIAGWQGSNRNTDVCMRKSEAAAPSVTTTGMPCIQWDNKVSVFRDLGSSTTCANPSESPFGPWCYFRRENNIIGAQTCFNTCIYTDMCLSKLASGSECWDWSSEEHCLLPNSYTGHKSTSRSGVPCAISDNNINSLTCSSDTGVGPRCLTIDGNWEFCYPPCYVDEETKSSSAVNKNNFISCSNKNKTCWMHYKAECSATNNRYVGDKVTDKDGNQCLFWDATVSWYKEKHKFCRNPTLDSELGPYCFIEALDGGNPIASPCFETCNDMLSPAQCFDHSEKCWKSDLALCEKVTYMGNQNIAVDGRQCVQSKRPCSVMSSGLPQCRVRNTNENYEQYNENSDEHDDDSHEDEDEHEDEVENYKTEKCFNDCDPEPMRQCVNVEDQCWNWNNRRCIYDKIKTYSRTGKKCIPISLTYTYNTKHVIMIEGICRRQPMISPQSSTVVAPNMAWCFTNDTHEPFEACYDPCRVNYNIKLEKEISKDSLWIDSIYSGIKIASDDTPDVIIDLTANAKTNTTNICASIAFRQYPSDHVTVYKERLDKSIVELLADIGGIVGLYFGFSAVTVIQLIYFCVKRSVAKSHKQKLEETKKQLIAATQSKMIASAFLRSNKAPEEPEPSVEDKASPDDVSCSTCGDALRKTEELERQINELKLSLKTD